jgi:formylglycine-generating enzyme required for sulfatase activity
MTSMPGTAAAPLRPDPTQAGKLRLDKCGALEGRPKLEPVRAYKAQAFTPGTRQGPEPTARAPKKGGPKPRKAALPPRLGSLRPDAAALAAHAAPAAARDDEVEIPAGTFLFGEERSERRLDAFRIDRFPTTHGEYEAFVRATGHRAPLYWPGGRMPDELRDHPVVGIDYYDAVAYARWRGKDVPYEDEWERAARGRDGRAYPWGPEPDLTAANTARSGLKMTVPVGFHAHNVSPEGVRDLVGNVWEFTHSPAPGGGIVVRGGSWYDFALYAKSYFRFASRPDARNGTIGFRCVRRDSPRADADREVDADRLEAEIASRRGPEVAADASKFSPERRDLVPDYRRLRNLIADRAAEEVRAGLFADLSGAGAARAASHAMPIVEEKPPSPPASSRAPEPKAPPAAPTPPPAKSPAAASIPASPPARQTPAAPLAKEAKDAKSAAAPPPPKREPLRPTGRPALVTPPAASAVTVPAPRPGPADVPAAPAPPPRPASASKPSGVPAAPVRAAAATAAPSSVVPPPASTIRAGGLHQAVSAAASMRPAASGASASTAAATERMSLLWWGAVAVGGALCVVLLVSLLINVVGGDDDAGDVYTADVGTAIVRESDEAETPLEPTDGTDPGADPEESAVPPPVAPEEVAVPTHPGDGAAPIWGDGAGGQWRDMVREGTWLLVFAPTPSADGLATVRAATEWHRRLRDSDVKVLLVVPRQDFLLGNDPLAPDAMVARLREYGASADVRVLLDPTSGPPHGSELRNAYRARNEVSAILLVKGRVEGQTSPPQGGFQTPLLESIAERARRHAERLAEAATRDSAGGSSEAEAETPPTR